jgi:hypothetical protein
VTKGLEGLGRTQSDLLRIIPQWGRFRPATHAWMPSSGYRDRERRPGRCVGLLPPPRRRAHGCDGNGVRVNPDGTKSRCF